MKYLMLLHLLRPLRPALLLSFSPYFSDPYLLLSSHPSSTAETEKTDGAVE